MLRVVKVLPAIKVLQEQLDQRETQAQQVLKVIQDPQVRREKQDLRENLVQRVQEEPLVLPALKERPVQLVHRAT